MVCDWSNTAFQPVEKTPYTRTCVTKQWPAVWIGACFLGPCVIGRLWLLGHWTTKKIIGSQKFDLKIFSVSTVSLRILDIRIYCSFDILGFRRFSRSTFSMQIYTNDEACCDERASERASGSCLFFRRRRRSCRRVPVSTFSRSLVVRCERRRRRGNKKLLKNFKKEKKKFVRVFFFKNLMSRDDEEAEVKNLVQVPKHQCVFLYDVRTYRTNPAVLFALVTIWFIALAVVLAPEA